MEDPRDTSQDPLDPVTPQSKPDTDLVHGKIAHDPGGDLGFTENIAWAALPAPPEVTQAGLDLRRRSFRRNLLLLLVFSLATFILTTWILVRVDSPFAGLSKGPQDVARAQLRALDRGELRPAYEMFSERYREQVSFDVWHELVMTHWRMFHADVLRAGTPAQSGPRVTIEIHLRGADDNEYRARYTLIRLDGRWWIDDVHWAQESNGRDFSRT